MAITERMPRLTPVSIAVVYAVAGSLWILFSDQLVSALVTDGALATYAQTLKGLLFVAVSALLVYGLVANSWRELERTNDRLDLAVQQTSILHRILRHNLRNTCNVIRGHAELLRENAGDEEECLRVIEEGTDDLVEISEKTRQLREIVLSDPEVSARIDVVNAVERELAAARDRFPDADVRAEGPDRAVIDTHPALGTAIGELVENAIVHNDRPAPTVRVSIGEPADDRVDLEIADDGPGLPEMEREVLEAGREEPTFHSEGLGLWLARTIVVQAGGDFQIAANEPHGTVVGISLPSIDGRGTSR